MEDNGFRRAARNLTMPEEWTLQTEKSQESLSQKYRIWCIITLESRHRNALIEQLGEVRMDALQQGILTLVRSAITGEKYILPQDFDLESAYEQICRHQIMPMVYIGAVQCGIPQDLPVMQKLFQDHQDCKARSEQQMKEQERLFAAFDRAGIEYMPVRGCDIKTLYLKPEMRPMRDADMLIRPEQRENIKKILTKLEFEEQDALCQASIWNKNTLCLSLYKRLIPSYNKAYQDYFGDGWPLASLRSGTQYSMVREDKLIYLFTRFAEHYYRGDLDCRHVIDFWVFRRAYTAFNDAHVRAVLKKLRLLTFYDNVQELLAVWFEDAAETEKTNFMTDYIFSSGANAGHTAGAVPAQKGRKDQMLTALFAKDPRHQALNYVGLNIRLEEKKSIFRI